MEKNKITEVKYNETYKEINREGMPMSRYLERKGIKDKR